MVYNKILNDAFISLVDDILFSKYVSNETKVSVIMQFMEQFTEQGWDIDSHIQEERIPFVGDVLFEEALKRFKDV